MKEDNKSVKQMIYLRLLNMHIYLGKWFKDIKIKKKKNKQNKENKCKLLWVCLINLEDHQEISQKNSI